MLELLPNHFSVEFCPFHETLIARMAELETVRGQMDCLIAPRGSGKTRVTTLAAPLHKALEGIERYQVILSERDDQATEKMRNIRRELQNNPLLRARYGELCDPGPVWRKDWIELKNGCVIKGFGAGANIRGTSEGENRPSFIYIDDPQGRKHITSPIERDKSMDWLNKDILFSGAPDGTTNFLVVGTALHPGCVVMELKKAVGWNHWTYAAIDPMPSNMGPWHEWKAMLNDFSVSAKEREKKALTFYESNRSVMDEGAKVLWPAMFSIYQKMVRWATKLGAFNTEDQGIPYDPSLAYFDPAYFEDQSGLPSIWFDDWPKDDDLVLKLVALDPSLGGTKDSDYQAFVAWAIDRNGREYIDAWLNREDVPGMAKRAIGICVKRKPRELILEANGFQRLLAADLKREAKEQGLLMLDIFECVEHVRWDKGTRIESLSSPLNCRKLCFKRNSPGVMMLIQQLKEYPFAVHDDAPDATSLCRFRAMQLMGG